MPEHRVSLREITEDTVRAICKLTVSENQTGFVAANALSIAEAHFSSFAWFRAVYEGDVPVGFVMLHEDRDKPDYFLWRFMIAAEYQGRGIGKRAMELVIDRVRTLPGATGLETSVVQAEGGPQGFYEALGFKLTGGYEEGEAVMRLDLRPGSG